MRCRSIKAGLNIAAGFLLTVQRRFFFFFFFFFVAILLCSCVDGFTCGICFVITCFSFFSWGSSSSYVISYVAFVLSLLTGAQIAEFYIR